MTTSASAKWIFRGVYIAAILLLCRTLTASPANSSWFARAWQTDDGLPNNTVTGVAQTPDGFLWVATTVGLARFDGIRFEELFLTNYVKEPNRGVVTLAKSHSGGLWLVMDRGQVVRLTSGAYQVFTAANGLPERTAEKLTEDGEGAAWVAYRNGTVCRIKDGQVATFGQAEGVPRGEVQSVATDRDGRVWLASGQQVCRFRDGHFEPVLERGESRIRLAAARSGGVWVCAGHQLLRCLDIGEVKECGEFPAQSAGTEVTVLMEDSAGAVWLGTYYNGLLRYDGTNFETIPTLYRDILSLAEDQEGSLWVGTAGGGLNRIRTRVVDLETEESGLPLSSVQSLSEGKDGILWAITRNGFLAYRDAGVWNTLSNAAGGLACVTVDRNGVVWAGTRNHQVLRWQNEKFVAWGGAQTPAGQVLHSLLATSAGDLWIGGAPGFLQRLRSPTSGVPPMDARRPLPEERGNERLPLVENVIEKDDVAGDRQAAQIESYKLPPDAGAVRAMVEDCYSNVWVGTARGTLLRLTGGTSFDETERLSLRRMSIRALHATADGSLWIGYAGWGLGRLKDGRLSRATTEQGLYDNYVSQIVDDGAGWLWCAGDHGIFKVRQQTIEDVFAGLQPSAQSIHYGGEEGLHNLQAAFGVSPGASRTRDGRLWMPMRTGLAVIDPAKSPRAARPPAVVLERVKVDGRTIAWYGGILPPPPGTERNVIDLHTRDARVRLGPAHRRLEFEFTGLSFAAPDNIHFRYKLNNYDEDWTETMARSASYSRLPDGDYRFEVSACNADGVWNQTGEALEFKVAPFVWQTWWFRLCVLAGFTSAMVGVGRYISFRRLRARLRGLEQQAALHKERARIARDIHDDLGTRLSEITLLTELASRKPADPDTSRDHVRQIASTARQVTDSLDEIVWAINPRNDSLPHVVTYIGQFALRFLDMAGIACHLDLPDQPPKRPISAEVRHNLFLVVKEALNNVVRHANATKVSLTITTKEETVVMTIKDNGRGFAAVPDDPTADGLRNMTQRMSDIGGRCHIESEPGAGTLVSCSYCLVSDEVRT